MIVTFKEEYLRNLYETGVSGDKKHRYQPGVVKGYKRGVDFLKWAERKEDLFRINSLHFEALIGDKRGKFSIRVGLGYRIEFAMSSASDEPILTICNIEKLSNHYD